MSAKRRKSEMVPDRGFHHSLGLLAEIRGWSGWAGALTLLLAAGMILIACFPSTVLRGDFVTRFVVGGLLGLVSVASGIGQYRQRSCLMAVRKAVIEQMDAATKTSARAERFYGLSILDSLTGLYNRRFGETRLEEEIAKAEGSGDPLLLIAMDFDRFKHINDTLGHAGGDMALKEFSRRLQRAVRACDVPIRVGGDEFLVILPDCPPGEVQTVISRMNSIEFVLNGKRFPLSFSYGMAQYQVNDTAEVITKRADQRLYDVKAEKKAAARTADSTAAKSELAHGLDSRLEPRPTLESPAGTRRELVRRSVRMPVDAPVLLIGSDLHGRGFSEQTVTLDVSRHGARVLSCQKLAAEQEMIVRCLRRNREAEVRVIRTMELRSGNFAYGLAFVDSGANIWGVDFRTLQEAEEKLPGWLFACTRCRSREVLDPADYTGRDNPGGTIVRSCKRCDSETGWASIMGSGAADVTDGQERALALAVEKAV
jgi:diguanylate cyclase (GGDEF)-like protein